MKSLSKNMRDALKIILSTEETKQINKNTLNSLSTRKFIHDNQLTREGWLYAISLLHLNAQCKILNLELIELNLNHTDRPEVSALRYFENNGYIGSHIEGTTIFNILKALMLDKLHCYNPFHDRNDACARFLEAQFTILKEKSEELISEILQTPKSIFLKNFDEIKNHPFISSNYPELDIRFAEKLFDIIDKQHLVNIAKKFSEAPYRYRSGWPDLTLIKGNQIEFVEVKTTDKLHLSQIDTISTMKQVIPYTFKVLRLTRSNIKNSNICL